jgi:hypothetical protein
LRVPVEHRKLGVFSTLNGYVFGAYNGRTDGAYGYTALDNAEAMRIGGPGTWSAGVFRAVVDCRAVAGPPHGRKATRDDAARIAEVVNECHAEEEVFLPYSAETVTARLHRATDLYTWPNVRVSERSVLGIWPAGLRVSIDDGERRAETVRAVALDYGFTADGVDDFRALLGAFCTDLLGQGHTEVMFLTSEGSPNYGLLSEVASRLDPFAFRMAVPEPPGTPERGVYVDPVYF